MGVTNQYGQVISIYEAGKMPELEVALGDFYQALIHSGSVVWDEQSPQWQAAQRHLSAEYFRLRHSREKANLSLLEAPLKVLIKKPIL